MKSTNSAGLPRREMLKALALAGLGTALTPAAFGRAAGKDSWRSSVLNYLCGLARPDGGYAWPDQAASHLTPTFGVVGCFRILDYTLAHKSALADYIRTHHPSRPKRLEQEHREFEFQQIQSLVWLGEDALSFRERVAGWKRPTVYLKQYEQHGYPVFRHEITAFTCRALLGLPMNDLSPDYLSYLNSRRRSNGSFNMTPVKDGGDGHVLNTLWGLEAIKTLGRLDEKKSETVAWLRTCQLPSGAFTWQPELPFAGNDDAAYTWGAVRALRLLGAEPKDREACISYLLSLANADGGFADRPGWLSNPLATYYVLDALDHLGALGALSNCRPKAARSINPLPRDLKVFSTQIEAHGKGSPAEAVDLARALGIHLWGAKNAAPEWISRAQAIANSRQVPVTFFVSNEEYGTWINVPGLGTYSHTSDLFAPAGRDFGAPLARQGVVSWPEFRERRMQPLVNARGRLVWQFGENQELVRVYLDDSLARGGYAAISTFHFGNPDFTNSEPFLQRWRGQIPFVALQDAHGEEPWWFADMTTGFRTLFLATEPTWENWLKALENNWVAAVRHDPVSGGKTWIHAGSPEVVDFINRNDSTWRWWENPQIQRPMVSVVAVRPEDEFETARPTNGVMIRVRCAWENTTQGRPKKALSELVELRVDGAKVSPELVSGKPVRGGGLADHFHKFHLSSPGPGKHIATAVVREIATRNLLERTIEFTV